MVQKPMQPLSSPTAHRRHPSAPPAVLVQSTRTPGLLSLSKPPHAIQQRPQQYQQQQRPPRSIQKGKSGNANQRSPQPIEAKAQPVDDSTTKKPSAPKGAAVKAPVAGPTPDKVFQGHQSVTPVKEKIIPRTMSPSVIHANRRQPHPHPHHQGSPPPPSPLSSQAEVSASSKPKSTRSQSLNRRNPKSTNLFDPFLVNNTSDNEVSTGAPTSTKSSSKPKQVDKALKLAVRPSGKLAHRRQNTVEVPGTPTPAPSKAVPVPHSKQPQSRGRDNGAKVLSRSQPAPSTLSTRPGLLHYATEQQSAAHGGFPICDDLTDAEGDDVSPPETPVREKGKTWQQSLVFEDSPRTAPLSATFSGFPFYPTPISTPTPERKRNHQRVSSESVFNLFMDDDSSASSSSSSSDGSEELKAMVGLMSRRRIMSANSTPASKSERKEDRPGFFASSNFQNSPSPEELPPPAFGLTF
ncbi:hypothetical protein EWM64_g8403 [Hericium alpestre]|uniref:Uncharacterized protein n=1 Tax=Hericium alpestre TaxID=135208 RepID=A0A4Y9ZQ89_9AGAM|nr:hypothetical protein EWM64_g8403 [Hericium alpestre]